MNTWIECLVFFWLTVYIAPSSSIDYVFLLLLRGQRNRTLMDFGHWLHGWYCVQVRYRFCHAVMAEVSGAATVVVTSAVMTSASSLSRCEMTSFEMTTMMTTMSWWCCARRTWCSRWRRRLPFKTRSTMVTTGCRRCVPAVVLTPLTIPSTCRKWSNSNQSRQVYTKNYHHLLESLFVPAIIWKNHARAPNIFLHRLYHVIDSIVPHYTIRAINWKGYAPRQKLFAYIVYIYSTLQHPLLPPAMLLVQ